MIEPPRIALAESVTAAVIHLQIPRDQIQAEMPGAINELMAAVSKQDIGPTGALFAHHLTTSMESFDFEVGVPVSTEVRPSGRVRPGELPGETVAQTTYHGGYEDLFAAWAEFDKRVETELREPIKAKGLKPSTTLWENYLKGPDSDQDPTTWRTELIRPLRQA